MATSEGIIKKFNEGTVAIKNLFWFGMGIFFIAMGYFKVQDHINDTQKHWTPDRNKRFWQLATKAELNTKIDFLQKQNKEQNKGIESLKAEVQSLKEKRELFDFRIKLNEEKLKNVDFTKNRSTGN